MEQADYRELIRWSKLAGEQREALAVEISNAVSRLFAVEEEHPSSSVAENWESLRKRA